MEKFTELPFAPFRNLNDFLMGASLYQQPNFGDFEKWGNRVVNNLLYYQTNYFAIIIFIILAMIFAYPLNMLIGFSTAAFAYMGYLQITYSEGAVKSFKVKHPVATVGCIAIVSALVLHLIGSLITFLFGILLPFSITFVHASFRKRNTKNKIMNKVEEMGIKKTPMGLILSSLSLEPKIFS